MSETVTPEINFFSEDIDFELSQPETYVRWINIILNAHKATGEAISYIFCSDEYLLKVNREYLNHDYYTDIISFPYAEFPQPISGDIFISIDRVKDNSLEHGTVFETELRRVMAHGLLHFLGFKDKSEEEQKLMREKEEEMIGIFNN